MPIRYFVDLSCVPREELGAEELFQLVVRWHRAQSIRDQFQEKYNLTDESQMRFKERLVGVATDADVQEVTVAEVRKDCQPLEKFGHHCDGCPAALDGTPYGCVQQISLPITVFAEQWLLDQLPAAGSRCLDLFVRSCESQGYGVNSVFTNWRKAGFLESDTVLSDERDGATLLSDQVLTEMLLVGDLMPVHALGVLMHLDAMVTSDGRRGDELLALIEQVDSEGLAEEAPQIEFGLKPLEGEDPSIRELKFFLYAMFTAFSLQSPLAIRL